MKKAKVMLTAIAVFVTVGGALAFKAAKFNTQNIYCTNSSIAARCSLTHYTSSTFAGELDVPAFTSYCTNAAASQLQCGVSRSVKAIQD